MDAETLTTITVPASLFWGHWDLLFAVGFAALLVLNLSGVNWFLRVVAVFMGVLAGANAVLWLFWINYAT